MIKSSLTTLTPSVALYTGNEGFVINRAIRYGRITYTWDTRFISFLDAFFLGIPIESTTGNVIEPLEKFIAFANGTLRTADRYHDMSHQYNEYLATLKLGK